MELHYRDFRFANSISGQKQLINLGRGLLRLKTGSSKILMLDETTACLDLATDKSIQSVLRRLTKGMTVICIAHRLETIIDFDRVLVMEGGVRVEIGKPVDLLKSADGTFTRLCKQTGRLHELVKMANL